MMMRTFAVSLALAVIAFAGVACATGSPSESESSEPDSLWDRTVESVTDTLEGYPELSEYTTEDTGWRTEPSHYGLHPEDFVVLPRTEGFLKLQKSTETLIVFDADTVKCEPYRWDSDTASAQLATPPQGVVYGTVSVSIDDDLEVLYGKVEARYICRVSSDNIIGFAVPTHLAEYVSAALDSYKRAMTEYGRATSTREDKEAKLDQALAKYCFNPPCRVANYDSFELSIAYRQVDEPDRKFFHDYNEAVYGVGEAGRAQREARRDASCWVSNAWSAMYVNHFPQTCGSPAVEATATAVALTATAIAPTATAVKYDNSGSGNPITITIDDQGGTYTMVASPMSVAAGEVTFNITNEGLIAHEFKVVKLNAAGMTVDLTDLPTEAGLISESGNMVDGVGTVLGSLLEADLPANGSDELTLTLEAGGYMLLCNVATHYQLGMWSEFTVT